VQTVAQAAGRCRKAQGVSPGKGLPHHHNPEGGAAGRGTMIRALSIPFALWWSALWDARSGWKQKSASPYERSAHACSQSRPGKMAPSPVCRYKFNNPSMIRIDKERLRFWCGDCIPEDAAASIVGSLPLRVDEFDGGCESCDSCRPVLNDTRRFSGQK